MSSNHKKLVRQTVLGEVTCYIMKESSVKGAKKKITQFCLNFINGCIKSYTDILNSFDRPKMVKQKKMEAVLVYIECDKTSDWGAFKARVKIFYWGEGGGRKAQENKIQHERYCEICLTLVVNVVEILWWGGPLL